MALSCEKPNKMGANRKEYAETYITTKNQEGICHPHRCTDATYRNEKRTITKMISNLPLHLSFENA